MIIAIFMGMLALSLVITGFDIIWVRIVSTVLFAVCGITANNIYEDLLTRIRILEDKRKEKGNKNEY